MRFAAISVRGHRPGPAKLHPDRELDGHVGKQPDERVTYSHSIDEVFINVFTETGLYQRSRTGINYPYIFPGKEIEDKLPTITIARVSTRSTAARTRRFRGGQSDTWSNTSTLVKGRHLQRGRHRRILGRRRFRSDQRQCDSGRHEQSKRPLRVPGHPGRRRITGLAIANVALGLFNNYAEIGERALTKWRSLATDIFLQDSWKPTSKLTHRRWHPVGLLATLVLDNQQHRELRPALLRSREGGRHRSDHRSPDWR